MTHADMNPVVHGDSIADLERYGVRKMLREAEVLMILSVSPVTLWRMVDAGRFPEPVFPAPNCKRWFMDEVVAWQRAVGGRDHQHEARQRAQRARRKREREAARREQAGVDT